MAADAFRSGLRRKPEPLRACAFRGLFAGAVCAGVTDGIVPVAFAVHSIQAFGSATSLTVILIALWTGRFACTPLAGLAAARRDQFAVMIGADAVRMVAQGGLALVLAAGCGLDVVGPVLLFIGCPTAGFAVAVTGIVRQALIQAQLPTDELGVFGSDEGFAGAAGSRPGWWPAGRRCPQPGQGSSRSVPS
ncbi:hypothetical protein AB0H60_17620 [Nocardia rhamnosiphila]|uniref:hypothetical protein n=1 Tax=Nocardia rhamnosiphila TaxID=426716 RepID=UPI0033DEA477